MGSSPFITGGTGYLGSYIVTRLLEDPSVDRVFLLTRAKDREEGVKKLWKALQLHHDPDAFYEMLPRIELVTGDLQNPGLGLDGADRERVKSECDSILHAAASLNRKSSKACFNANLRGTLSVLKLAREMAETRADFRRFGYVSTTAVSGRREHQIVGEDESIDWSLSDYDPYARTKKFAEHMVHELIGDLPTVILRPPTVMGDSRFPQTTQFDMIRITCWMIDSPVVPMHPDTRLDFVPADFVGPAIADLFMKPELAWDTYHLSAGEGARTGRDLTRVLQNAGIRVPRLTPRLQGTFEAITDQLANAPRGTISLYASLIKVFLPYFTNDVVFDNTRVVTELGRRPTPFSEYFLDLYRWAKSVRFEYPYRPLPMRGRDIPRAAE